MANQIGDWIDKLKEFFGGNVPASNQSTPNNFKNSPATNEVPDDGSYQAPVKGSWSNSGDFSPGVATDARHPGGHQGIDIRTSGGSAVYPIAAGVVSNVGTDPKGGNVINIKHEKGVATYYAHLGTVRVHKGEKVDKNTIIGSVGDSGNAAGFPHLHFQVWQNGQLTNPSTFFSVPKYTPVSKSEQAWLPGHQQIAKNWNMQKHQKAIASAKISILCEGCDIYFNLIKKL